MTSTYWSPAQVLCLGGNAETNSCHVEHISQPGSANVPPLPTEGESIDLRGLNELQFSRTRWLNGDAIEKALRSYHRSLPKRLQAKIHIAASDNELLFLDGVGSDARFQSQIQKPLGRFFRSFKQTEYTIWPVNYNNLHWVLVVIHKENPTNTAAGGWARIAQIAVMDPWQDKRRSNRVALIWRRCYELFGRGGFDMAEDARRDVWVPVQNDSHSCGPRAYWAGRKIMERLILLEEVNRGYHESLWYDMDPWFNNDQVRWEMIGSNAYEAIRIMKYKARVAVELVHSVKELGPNNNFKISDAGTGMQPGDENEELKPRPARRNQQKPTPIQPNNPTQSRKRQAPEPDYETENRDDDGQPAKTKRPRGRGRIIRPTSPSAIFGPGANSTTRSYPVPHRYKIAPQWSLTDDYVAFDALLAPPERDPIWQPTAQDGRTLLAHQAGRLALSSNFPRGNRKLFYGDRQFTPRKE
ncbi:hypothetical protein F4779DRAFT_576272 [Xylariaceae sp. FL0662B]|nr:hypothetical protein F4779DRAFT_576272 [Xylariaceae sp. FL0662B]